jgi:hypothetical protein
MTVKKFGCLMLILMVFQHVCHVRFMCLPPTSISLSLWWVGATSNMFRKPEDMPYTVQIFFLWHLSNVVQKKGAEVGHFQGKTWFLVIVLQNHSRFLWSSNLESLYDIAVCDCLHQFWFILTRLSLGRKVDTLELLRHTVNSETFCCLFRPQNKLGHNH